MKNVETSYSKKENKKNGKIKFEKFPGDTKKEMNQIWVEKPKKISWLFTIIIIYIILLIASGFLNKKILDENDDTYYKLVNHYNGNMLT